MSEWKRPLPTITGESLPYWEACRRGELLIQRCDQCREYQFYPRGICAKLLHRQGAMGQGQRQRLCLDLYRHPVRTAPPVSTKALTPSRWWSLRRA